VGVCLFFCLNRGIRRRKVAQTRTKQQLSLIIVVAVFSQLVLCSAVLSCRILLYAKQAHVWPKVLPLYHFAVDRRPGQHRRLVSRGSCFAVFRFFGFRFRRLKEVHTEKIRSLWTRHWRTHFKTVIVVLYILEVLDSNWYVLHPDLKYNYFKDKVFLTF